MRFCANETSSYGRIFEHKEYIQQINLYRNLDRVNETGKIRQDAIDVSSLSENRHDNRDNFLRCTKLLINAINFDPVFLQINLQVMR